MKITKTIEEIEYLVFKVELPKEYHNFNFHNFQPVDCVFEIGSKFLTLKIKRNKK